MKLANPFYSPRTVLLDLPLICFSALAPRLFTIFLVVFFRSHCRALSISRKHAITKAIFSSHRQFVQNSRTPQFTTMDLIAPVPHMREFTFLSKFRGNLRRFVSCGGSDFGQLDLSGIERYEIPRDWVAVWLYVFEMASKESLFVCSGLSDLWFFPLKFHPYKNNLAFDSYDPINEYNPSRLLKLLSRLNYRVGINYFVRDSRFLRNLKRSGRRTFNFIKLLDSSRLPTVSTESANDKLSRMGEYPTFISSGWVTSDGDGGLLRTVTLLREIFPQSKIHLCFTEFMQKNDQLFSGLVEFGEKDKLCNIYVGLSEAAYKKLLDESHFGINLHDPIVFGEKYKNFDYAVIRRSPSSRVLDYGARGCALLTTKAHRFSTYQFKSVSPHCKVLCLTSQSKAEDFYRLGRQ